MTNNHKLIEESKSQMVADFAISATSETSVNVFEDVAGRSCSSSDCDNDRCWWGTE